MTSTLLFEAAVRVLIVALVAGACLLPVRKRNPHMERTIWCAVLAAALAMPLLMSLPRPEVVAMAVSAEPATAQLAGLTTKAGSQWLTLLPYLYWSVAALLLVRQAVALLRAHALRRKAQPLHASWTEQLDVRVSPQLRAPASIGATILLPEDHEQWSETERCAVVAHERAHVRRGDFLLMACAYLHRALFWFSPLAWWLPRRLALLNEHLSDDAAMAALHDRDSYAHLLLDFAAREPHGAATIAMARPATISRRIERILKESEVAARPSIAFRAGIISALAAATLLSALGVAATTVDTPPRSNPRFPLAAPGYPAESRLLGEEGTVVMRLYVRVDGTVAEVQIKESSNFPRLDLSAAQTAQLWVLRPALADASPVGAWGNFAVTFKLTDDP